MTKNELGKKGFIISYRLESIIKESQSGGSEHEYKGGTESETMDKFSLRT